MFYDALLISIDMRENIFKFKQFSVQNEKSAMKVGTDGVLLGAWCNVNGVNSVLDIGCGTGLISLMIAQRQADAKIDAVEIDNDAHNEALINFTNSPWANRLNAILADFNDFVTICHHKYDLIVSNPPFFTNGILPPDESRKNARHCNSLSFSDLLNGAHYLLTEAGRICLITPYDNQTTIASLANSYELFIKKKTIIYPKPNSPAKRILWELVKMDVEKSITDDLIIETSERHRYSDEYIKLTKDFYLKM